MFWHSTNVILYIHIHNIYICDVSICEQHLHIQHAGCNVDQNVAEHVWQHPTLACPCRPCKIASNQSWSGTADSFGPENSWSNQRRVSTELLAVRATHVKLFYQVFTPKAFVMACNVLHNAPASWWYDCYDCQKTLIVSEMVHRFEQAASSIKQEADSAAISWGRNCQHCLRFWQSLSLSWGELIGKIGS